MTAAGEGLVVGLPVDPHLPVMEAAATADLRMALAARGDPVATMTATRLDATRGAGDTMSHSTVDTSVKDDDPLATRVTGWRSLNH